MSRKSNDRPRAAQRQALIAAVGNATQAFQRASDAFDDAVAERLGLNRTDLRCLDWLFDGPKTAGQLAAAIGLSSAATTTLLDRLERRGLVRRVRDVVDRRKVLVEMSEDGWRQTDAFYAPLTQAGAHMLERFSDDQLSAMRDQLEAATQLIERHRARLRDEPAPPEHP